MYPSLMIKYNIFPDTDKLNIMKQSLLGGLISVIAATTKGAVDNKDNIRAGLQSEAGKAYQDSLTATLSKQIKTVGSADSTVVCSAEEKENLKNVVSGLQSQISSIAAHATLAAAQLSPGKSVSHRSQYANCCTTTRCCGGHRC